MSRCRQCNVEVLDETERCPLCNSVLEQTFEVENMYPDVRIQTRRLTFLSRVYLFGILLLEVILFSINYFDRYKIGWSLIVGLILFYGSGPPLRDLVRAVTVLRLWCWQRLLF